MGRDPAVFPPWKSHQQLHGCSVLPPAGPSYKHLVRTAQACCTGPEVLKMAAMASDVQTAERAPGPGLTC